MIVDKISKKHIKILIILLVLFGSFLVANSYAIIRVDNMGDVPRTLIVRSLINGEVNIVKDVEITDKKTFVLKKGYYYISVEKDIQKSNSFKELKSFRINNVKVSSSDQKSSLYLGSSEFDCVSNLSNPNSFLSYPCINTQDSLSLNQYNEKRLVLDPGYGEFGEDEHSSPETKPIENETSYQLPVIKAYGDGLLVADSNKNLVLRFVDKDGKYSEASDKNIQTSQVTTDSLAVSDKTGDQRVAILDRKANEVLLFDSYSSNEPKKISLGGRLKDLSEQNQTKVLLTKDRIFVAITKPIDVLDSLHSKEEDKELVKEIKKASENQKIIEVNLATSKVEEIDLGDDKNINNIFAIYDKNQVVVMSTLSFDQPLIVGSDSKQYLDLNPYDIKNICAGPDDSLFYSAVSTNEVYRYSIPDRISYMEYASTEDNINNLDCKFGMVSFVTESDNRVYDNPFGIILLGQKPQEKIRIENILPKSETYRADTYYLEPFTNKVQVRGLYDSNGNGYLKSEDFIKHIRSILIDGGVDADKYELDFKY